MDRLNGPDRLNYTAIIRSLYEEVLGPPLPPPPLPPDPPGTYSTVDNRVFVNRKFAEVSWNRRQRSYSTVEASSPNRKSIMSSWSARQRSYSALDARTSASRDTRTRGWEAPKHSTSVEELSRLQYSLV